MYMETFNKTPLNTVKRIPARGRYDKETVFEILDTARVGHVGFVVEGRPFVIPTLYGRKDDILYLHGATTSRMLQQLETMPKTTSCRCGRGTAHAAELWPAGVRPGCVAGGGGFGERAAGDVLMC